MSRMDQEPDYGDEPLPPPTPEEERIEAWEYWHQRAHRFETALHQIRVVCDDNANIGNTTLALKFVREVANTALTEGKRA
jgi:hypothetical protein